MRSCVAMVATCRSRTSFDWVHSSAVLEHVGSAADQARVIAELYRVCRKGIFVTTPNRWFPVEFHSVLPLVHWLPKPWFRALLLRMGHAELAQEQHLNLMGRRDLEAACVAAGLGGWSIDSVALGGWPSNLLLVARRHERGGWRGPGAAAGSGYRRQTRGCRPPRNVCRCCWCAGVVPAVALLAEPGTLRLVWRHTPPASPWALDGRLHR